MSSPSNSPTASMGTPRPPYARCTKSGGPGRVGSYWAPPCWCFGRTTLRAVVKTSLFGCVASPFGSQSQPRSAASWTLCRPRGTTGSRMSITACLPTSMLLGGGPRNRQFGLHQLCGALRHVATVQYCCAYSLPRPRLGLPLLEWLQLRVIKCGRHHDRNVSNEHRKVSISANVRQELSCERSGPRSSCTEQGNRHLAYALLSTKRCSRIRRDSARPSAAERSASRSYELHMCNTRCRLVPSIRRIIITCRSS